MGERNLSILVHSLFSAWMLSFLFNGEVLLSITDIYQIDPTAMVLGGVAANFAGLLLCALLIKTKKAAKNLYLWSFPVLISISVMFFFPPTQAWLFGILIGSMLAGGCVAGWSFFLKSGSRKPERLKTIADALILSNVLMMVLNVISIYRSPLISLGLSMLMIGMAFCLALHLPEADSAEDHIKRAPKSGGPGLGRILAFLSLFIVIITINSGLMYQVINPAFAHLKWLQSWFWVIPYIVALLIIRNLPQSAEKTPMLYIGIAMIGLAFIGFMVLDRSVGSYLIIDTLMLGAFGVYDLFWWSSLGEMLDLHQYPARIFGIGLSANVLGVLIGQLSVKLFLTPDQVSPNLALVALVVVFVALMLLPTLHKRLSNLLTEHSFLNNFSSLSKQGQEFRIKRSPSFGTLSKRELEVTSCLLQGKTYKRIAEELFISENTVKFFVKSIYTKFNIHNRAELMNLLLADGSQSEIQP